MFCQSQFCRWLLVLLFLFPLTVLAAEPFEQERNALITEYVEKEGVKNPRVLAALRQTPRHLFVPADMRPYAYTDQALPIGHEQTISPPFIVAYMTEILDPQPTDKVLEIGTGSGYQAAVLSPLVETVFTIEIVEPLGKRAAATLRRLKYDNIETKIGDGYLGWPEQAPFDKIIVTCSPENIPQPLISQLRDGGKMIIPVGERYQQVFYLLEKQNGKLITQPLQPTLFVPMTGQSEANRQVKPNPQQPQVVNGSFERDENGDGFVDGYHYQRRMRRIEGNAPAGNYYIQFENDRVGQMAHTLQGFAIDGRSVRQLMITLDVWLQQFQSGPLPHQIPGFVIHYYDDKRKPITSDRIGEWEVSADWVKLQHVVEVPELAREAIFQIGLNGASGTVAVDDVSITPRH